MQTTKIDIDKIKLNPSNPRTISGDKFDKLVQSIKDFPEMLEIRPVVVNDDMVILGGNMRLKAAEKAGMSEIPIIKASQLTTEQQREFIIKDNVGYGAWDWDLLARDWDADTLTDWGMDINGNWPVEPVQGLTNDDAIPEEVDPICKEGDLWLLGDHRLLCGDATKKEDVDRLLGGESADMLLTDPPYGVNYSAKNEFLNIADKGNRIQKDIINDTDSAEETVEMWRKYFKNVKEILRDGANYYINFSGDKLLLLLLLLLREKEINLPEKQILVWVKNNHVLGRSNYNYKHEFILYGWNGSNGHKHYGGFDTTVWEIDKPLKNDLHPTMKPIELLERAIDHGTTRMMNVYDGFLGSGSTLIACEKTNRKCYGLEIDPHYCDVIIQRWENYTGKKAEKIDT